jgi:hypothetical protein
MGSLAKILSLSYDSAVATKTSALKSYYRSVRLIKNSDAVNPPTDSKYANILLCGNCVDPETRNLYVSYIDIYFGYAWIIEINIDSRRQNVVYFDKDNNIGFNPLHKFYNMRVVHGRLVWTDDLNPIYQMDIARAKRSFQYRIGYGEYPVTVEWDNLTPFGIDQIVSNGNYFYKNKIDHNSGTEPKTDNGVKWEVLCLIEDAYYSMDVKNFYFEPVPPKHPPEVSYQSDDTRKINNLRQTLWQVCYRYVYMDWRKSTFSPASIVPVPQAEEETATGLANEQISLNNKLQIIVNSGGEEVRAIEIVGRSSQDPAKWFLIETINKFEAQERGNEISRTSEAEFVTLGFSFPLTSVMGVNNPNPGDNMLGLTIREPFVLNTFTFAQAVGLSWNADQGGVEKTVTIQCNPNLTYITSFPDWIGLKHFSGYGLYVGMSIQNNETITAYPLSNNTGPGRSGYVVLTNSYGDLVHIIVTQAAVYVPPVVPMTPVVSVDPGDTSGLSIVGVTANGTSGNTLVTFSMLVNCPGYVIGATFTMFWRATINGAAHGNGSFVAHNGTTTVGSLNLDTAPIASDNVVIFISALAILEKTIDAVPLGLAPLSPSPINSEVLVSQGGVGWDAVDYSMGEALPIVVTCPPVNCSLTSKPNWLTIRGSGGYDLGVGATIINGETISLFPTVANLGGVLSGYVVLTNSFGDSASIFVTQGAPSVPPIGTPVACSILKYSGDYSAMVIPGSSASALSGDNRISWSCMITGLTGSTLYWRAYKAGSAVIQGSGSFAAHNGSNYGTVVLDNLLLVGDVITIYFSSVTF